MSVPTSFSWYTQLFRTRPGMLSGPQAFQGFILEKALLALRTQLQFLVSGCWCQPLCSPGVGDLKMGIEAIEVI